MSEITNDKNLTLILAGKGKLGVKINCTNGSIDPENLYHDGSIKIKI